MIPQSSLSVDGVKGHLYVTRYGVCSDLSRREIIQKRGGGESERSVFNQINYAIDGVQIICNFYMN
jgi:hypothetical protein